MLNKAGGIEKNTILHIASEYNYVKIVLILLKHKADIFQRRADGKTAYNLC